MSLESVLSRPGTALITAKGPLPSLRHGQILSARIETVLPNGAARLASPAGGFEARLPPGLTPGATLQLQALRNGSDLKLIILERTAPAAPRGVTQGELPLAAARQTAIGAQDSLAPLVANAGAALGSAGGPLPGSIQTAIAQLIGLRLPAGGPLSGDAVRDGVLNSGLFYEAKLAAGAAPAALSGDMKAILLALQAALRAWLGGEPPARQGVAKTPPPLRGGGATAGGGAASPVDLRALSPPEIAQLLFAQTAAALARLRLAQIASLPDDHDGARSRSDKGGAAEWTFELPFAIGDKTAVVQFNLSREPSPSGRDKETVWRIAFSLDVDPLGPVHAAITWQREQVAVTLWAETDDGARRLRRETSALNAALDGADLVIERVQVLAGRPEHDRPAAGAFVDRVT